MIIPSYFCLKGTGGWYSPPLRGGGGFALPCVSVCVGESYYPHPPAGLVGVVVALWGRGLWLPQETFAETAALALCAAWAHYCTHRYAYCCAAVPRAGGDDWTLCSHFNVYVLIGFLPPTERESQTKDFIASPCRLDNWGRAGGRLPAAGPSVPPCAGPDRLLELR